MDSLLNVSKLTENRGYVLTHYIKPLRVTNKTFALVRCMFRITSITVKLDPFRDGFYFFIRFFSFYFYLRISKGIIFTVAIVIVTLLGMIKIVRQV